MENRIEKIIFNLKEAEKLATEGHNMEDYLIAGSIEMLFATLALSEGGKRLYLEGMIALIGKLKNADEMEELTGNQIALG